MYVKKTSTKFNKSTTTKPNKSFSMPVFPDNPPDPPLLERSVENGSEGDVTDVIKPCLNKYVYIWLKDGSSFWMYLVYAEEGYIGGWIWLDTQWHYFGTCMYNVDSFVSYS
ncbi:hypothetical protein [Crassaminicella profunda]|uniref:hypothetical protein n=1 Tax=Crassaminicella profunda TaxID=1286698 RepID=UPI001CA77448|nr:hypothetical protein [Crassaminicella profunda]QZY56695.1 hypothetical protein K7H06_07180 [Crassaminicella profunda]